jgi:hypothetical protein
MKYIALVKVIINSKNPKVQTNPESMVLKWYPDIQSAKIAF